MQKQLDTISKFDWTSLENDTAYAEWRAAKLAVAAATGCDNEITIKCFESPSESEINELFLRCRIANLALYRAEDSNSDPDKLRHQLRGFADALGLKVAEAHRSAGEAGVVALQVSDAPKQAGYIPYTPRKLHWHTDGYYNGAEDRVNAFVLHCARPAAEGGENMLLDPELAYLRLRDENPNYIDALMQPDAMTIPENVDGDKIRPAAIGPVFFADPASGRLQLRYTARTRSIEWSDAARPAADWLAAHLAKGDPLMQHLRLDAGQGILNNNVLHNRTAFTNGDTLEQTRLIFRVRFANRLREET